MRRVRLRNVAAAAPTRNDAPLARENARLRQILVDAERELSRCERAAWAGGRACLEPHMKGALSILRAGLDR